MRGIRQQFHWHENPLYRFAPTPVQLVEPNVMRNIAQLADYGWCFDLQVFSGQMADAARLAETCPDMTFILQHAGMLEDTSDGGWMAWRDGMERLAACSDVVTKFSAFGTFIHRNDPDFIVTMIVETEKIFGAKRCLFGSNSPIEKIWTDYRSLFDAFRAGAAALPKARQKAIFNDTAARIYRL